MIEHTEPDDAGRAAPSWSAARRRPAPSSPSPAPTSPGARRCSAAATVIGSREIGMLATAGIAEMPAVRKPRVGVLSTGDELVAPGKALRPAAIYDANGPTVAAAVAENGGEPIFYGAFPDDEAVLGGALRARLRGLRRGDPVRRHLQGRGRSHLSARRRAWGSPGIVAHGVALKPGKPLCLAVCDGKPVVVLPGFPDLGPVHLPRHRRSRCCAASPGCPRGTEARVPATVPVRVPSELGRTEYVMVSLVERDGGFCGLPDRQGLRLRHLLRPGRRLLTVEALADALPAGERRRPSRCSAPACARPTSP